MPSPVQPAGRVRPRARIHRAFRASCLAIAVFATTTADADLGRWTPSEDWRGGDDGRYAIHLMLLPEQDDPDRSRIFWFAGYNQCCAFRGGEWRWGPGNDNCTAVPSTGWSPLPTPSSPVMNLFCTSHAPFGDGRMVFAGGDNHDTHSYGERRSKTLQAGAGTNGSAWGPTDPGLMSDWRWYPTATTLRDGRVLVTGGDRYPHHRVFGGRRGETASPASPSWGDTVFRFAPVENGYWDSGSLPLPDPVTNGSPDPRHGHSGVEMAKVSGFQGQAFFGGIGSNGQPRNDAWLLTREDNTLGSDYIYRWKDLVPTGTRPPERSSPSAVAALGSQMVVYGGLNADGTPRDDVWRLHRSGASYFWQDMSVTGTTTPGARCGHAAVYDETVLAGGGGTRKRMIVFGGVSAPGQTPTDDKVWELRWDDPGQPNQATWHEMTLANPGGPKPSPRYWHTFTQDPGNRTTDLKYTHPGTGKKANIAWLYGGALGSNAYSDQLWALWILDDGTVDWRPVTIGPSTDQAGARARHSVVLDPWQGYDLTTRLYIMGGENASGPVDPFVYKLDPWAPCWLQGCSSGQSCGHSSCGPRWSKWAQYEHTLVGHTMLLEFTTNASAPRQVQTGLARVAETISPSTLLYQKHESANLYSRYSYPMNFVVPGGLGSGCRVVSVGRGAENTYHLDVPDNGFATGWVLRAGQGAGFDAEGGVMYTPGQVMIAGGVQSGSATGLTKTADLSSSSPWQSSQSMLARKNHNLVALPNGTVLAVGGELNSTSPVQRPQIWDPDGNGGAGTWTPDFGTAALAQQPLRRGYHSTAILLPDARVLSAGGEYETQGDKWKAEIFCPPYLFKDDGTPAHSLRPVITGAPTTVDYRKVFTVCTPDPARITRACLIRPGATTHAFDQNQRRIPLTFTPASSGPPRLFVTAPASPDSAPPGYYLLFVTGAYDATTSTTYPDLPSIAKWVKLEDGPDACDQVSPATLAAPELDIVGPNELWFTWTATADDEAIAESGNAQEFDLRANTGPLTNDDAWAAAAQSGNESSPGASGSFGWGGVTGLAPCTPYYAGVRARDDNAHLSGFPPTAVFQTSCGGGGGGFSATAAGPEESGAGAGILGASAELTTFTLVAETSRTAEGAWHVVLRHATAADGISPAAGIVIDREDGSGGRDTLGRIAPEETHGVLGICSLRDRGRVSLPGVYRIDQISANLNHGTRHLALSAARHSRLGPMSEAFIAGGGGAELLVGDVIDLTYEPAGGTPPASAWYVLVQRRGAGTPTPYSQRPRVGEASPARFALHQNEPNPAGTSTLIRFDLPHATAVRLEVFDLLGRKVAVLADGPYSAGSHVATWDLRGGPGARPRPGFYLCRLTAGAFRAQRAMVLLQ